MPRRHSPGRQLAHQGTDISDLVQQVVMPARVEPVHASGQHRDRVTTSSQRSTMHCTLDPKSTTSDQQALPTRQITSQLA